MGLDYHGPYVPTGRGDLWCPTWGLLAIGGLMDQFTWFCLSNQTKIFLAQYQSPKDESSLFKNIPIKELDRVKRILKPLGDFRIVYRGPRRNQRDPSITHKADAERFSVYVR
jgi:hypothetical protein